MLRSLRALLAPFGVRYLVAGEGDLAVEAIDGVAGVDLMAILLANSPLHTAIESVNRNCAACHQQFRDVPLKEKGKQ